MIDTPRVAVDGSINVIDRKTAGGGAGAGQRTVARPGGGRRRREPADRIPLEEPARICGRVEGPAGPGSWGVDRHRDRPADADARAGRRRARPTAQNRERAGEACGDLRRVRVATEDVRAARA